MMMGSASHQCTVFNQTRKRPALCAGVHPPAPRLWYEPTVRPGWPEVPERTL